MEHSDIPTSSRHACLYSERVAASEPGPSYVPTNPTEPETSEPGPSSSSSAVVPPRVSGSRKMKSKPQKHIPEKRQFTVESPTPSVQLPRVEIDQAPVIEQGESNVPIMTPRIIDIILSQIPEIDRKFLPRTYSELKRVPRLVNEHKTSCVVIPDCWSLPGFSSPITTLLTDTSLSSKNLIEQILKKEMDLCVD